jgi:hypothetical protein
MTADTGPSLDALGRGVAASSPSDATRAALDALRAKAPLVEVVRAASVAAARHHAGPRAAPRGLALLASASHLARPLAVLQAVAYVASEPRSATPARPPAVVSGEITHLGRSFLIDVRAGRIEEASAIFLGMLDERAERKMAGDMLFRAAVEDMGEGGRKLFISVRSWQLARALGFREGRALLRPAVEYIAGGPSDRTSYETILGILGKEWVDLESLGSGGRPLDEAGRGAVASVADAPTADACVAGTLSLLRDGYAASSIAEGLVVEASRRVIASSGFDREAVRGLLFAHAARVTLTFSRTNERLYALFQAALRVRSPLRAEEPTSAVPGVPVEESIRGIGASLEGRRASDAVARVRAYLVAGGPADRLLDLLADFATRDACASNEGLNLFLADACAEEYRASGAPEVPMALAKAIAASPTDTKAYDAWRGSLAA